MRKALLISALTLVFLVAIDVLVAMTLTWAERTGRLGGLVTFFEYGRSVPGKLERWKADPDLPGNLFDVGWRSDTLAESAKAFAEESPDTGPVIRSYGMSFVVNIRNQALALRPDLAWDTHAGPIGPPNYTYALFEDDRANRRAGDIAIFGILSSAVPTMAALSNRTRVFEQPAPMTYPIYRPEGDDLRRIDPLVTSPADERALANAPAARAAWHEQLAREDAYHSPITSGFVWADISPFARLVRRSLAKSHIESRTAEILQGGVYPYETALRGMIQAFAETARANDQLPVVMLIQTADRMDPDILAISRSILEAEDIPYFATAEHFDPQNRTGFMNDGHYTPKVDRMFAEHLLKMLGL